MKKIASLIFLSVFLVGCSERGGFFKHATIERLGGTAQVEALTPDTASVTDFETFVPYEGSILKLDTRTFLCKSNRVASGGYWLGPGGNTEKGGSINTESSDSTWRITLNPVEHSAQVITFSGASQTIEHPDIYTLEQTPGGRWLLVLEERPLGLAPQMITIDPTNSSFVYASLHANIFHNRGNIFWGTCIPYV